MTTISGSQTAEAGLRVKGLSPWVWALRRAAYGVLILTVTIAGAAWLLYAAIDPDAEASAQVSQTRAKIEAPARTPAAGKQPGAVATRD